VTDIDNIGYGLIPSPSGPNNFISPAGQAMTPDASSRVYYKGDQEKLVVQYDNVPNAYTKDRCTYQVILYKSGIIDYVYKAMYYTFSTIGMENATGTDGLQMDYVVDFDVPVFGTTVRIWPAATWIQPQLPEGIVHAGESQTIPVAFNAADLEPGVYETTLFVGTNDPHRRAAGIPISFTVKEKAIVGIEEEADAAVKVHPVPSEDVVNITIRRPIPQGAFITMGNAQGQIMYRAEVPAGTTSHQLRLRDLHAAEGIYYLKVDAGGWTEVRKVAKK